MAKAAAKGGEKKGPLQPKEHAGAGLPVVAPRLKLFYEQTVRGRLQQLREELIATT